MVQKEISMNSKEFALKIEEIVKEKKLTHMEAVVWYCEKNEIDLTTVKPIINKVLKEKIKKNAEELHYFPKSGTLPV